MEKIKEHNLKIKLILTLKLSMNYDEFCSKVLYRCIIINNINKHGIHTFMYLYLSIGCMLDNKKIYKIISYSKMYIKIINVDLMM